MFGPVLYEAFREIKRTFDPAGIFNPGKIVDAPPLTSNLRFGAGYKTANPPTWFDFDEYGGMGGAVEMCSGVGACRKKLAGTMCPSYMATLEEAHSTRGRANVLRLAMSGRMADAGLDDEGVREVLDLCLECRACKSECPVGVDVARLKSEFLAGYWDRHGTPLRVRALGQIDRLSRWVGLFAPLANWFNTAAWGGGSISVRRRLRFPHGHRTFENGAAATPSAGNERAAVTLFNDTFIITMIRDRRRRASDPVEGGCAATVVRPGCCGTSADPGALPQALYAERVLGLLPIAEPREDLFCEPVVSPPSKRMRPRAR
jgi:NAD-dependent dihydropyrimidine dehydrogenase PreA subunit